MSGYRRSGPGPWIVAMLCAIAASWAAWRWKGSEQETAFWKRDAQAMATVAALDRIEIAAWEDQAKHYRTAAAAARRAR